MTNPAPKSGKPKLKLKVIGVTVNGKIKNKKIGELSAIERKYYSDLHKIIDEVFSEAEKTHDWNWGQLAEQAGLARTTVDNLGDRITKYPRFMTIYRLALAVGWELVIRERKATKAALKIG